MIGGWTFRLLLAGQVASWLGSGMAGFAVGVWAFQETGSATQFALITFFGVLPGLLLSPLAGVLVDRWDRRWVMILADTVAALTSVVLILLLWPENRLEVWHLYVVTTVNGLFNALQQPAFQASIPLLVAKERLGRAAGMVQMGTAAPQMLAPFLAGALFAPAGLTGILVMDLVTAGVAITTLLFVKIPKPSHGTSEVSEGQNVTPQRISAVFQGFWTEAMEGWDFIRVRSGLVALLALFAIVNLANGMVQVLLAPMILSFADPVALGSVLIATSGAFLVGGAWMTATGGPQRRTRAIVTIIALQGGLLALAGSSARVVWIAVALSAFMVMMPVAAGSSQVIWQSKVPPRLMGRVFAIRRLLAMSTLPVAYLVAGPLADAVFEPWMQPGGWLAARLGPYWGVGPGRGIGLLFLVLGLIVIGCGLVASRSRRLLQLEEELEDQVDQGAFATP